MSETGTGSWCVASGPDEDGDDWVIVFRMDDEDPDSEGPQIVVTGSPMSSIYQEDGDEFASYGNRTDFEYQIWGPEKSLVARLRVEDPDDYHGGWESESFEEASERAMIVVEQFADSPDYWGWDGTAEWMGLKPVRPSGSR